MLGPFDLVILLLFFVSLRKLIQLIKYGRTRLRFAEFPFFVGQKMKLSLHLGRGHLQLRGLEFRLLFIEEVLETVKTRNGSSTRKVCYQKYEDRQIFQDHALGFLSSTSIPVSFELPDLAFETRLAQKAPSYSLLQVRAKATGVDFDTSFVLPVYSKAGAQPRERTKVLAGYQSS